MAPIVEQPVPVTYIDTRFRTRLIVFPDGSHIIVMAGETAVMTRQHVEYLESHKCFKRIPTK